MHGGSFIHGLPVTWEAAVGGSLEPRTCRPAWVTDTLRLRLKEKKLLYYDLVFYFSPPILICDF
jgi:hypothetical protein